MHEGSSMESGDYSVTGSLDVTCDWRTLLLYPVITTITITLWYAHVIKGWVLTVSTMVDLGRAFTSSPTW